MSVMTIKSNIRNYDVRFGNTAEFMEQIIKAYPQRCFVIDQTVWDLYQQTHFANLNEHETIVLPISEERKSLVTVQLIYDQLIERSAKRSLALVSIGGGITQDITGFVASSLYRGIKWLYFPTTLLAQADSCIGSKTSLNYKDFKNLIGTFYPPTCVFIDTAFLNTQNELDFFSGLGEIVKLHIMGGESHVQRLLSDFEGIASRNRRPLENAVRESLLIKQDYIENDEFDNGRRNLLNFGHCFGHALETASHFAIPHGQAVVAGMILSNIVSRNRGLLASALECFVLERLLRRSLPSKLEKAFLDPVLVVEAMKKDKKRTGNGLPLVMLIDDFKMTRVNDVDESEVVRAIKDAEAILTQET